MLCASLARGATWPHERRKLLPMQRTVRTLGRRSFATASRPGFFEIKTDHVLPGRLSGYLDEVERTAADRESFII